MGNENIIKLCVWQTHHFLGASLTGEKNKSRTHDLQSFCPLECKLEQSGDLSRDQDVAEVKEATAALESEADRIQVSFQKSLSQLRDLASDDLFLRLSGKCTVL